MPNVVAGAIVEDGLADDRAPLKDTNMQGARPERDGVGRAEPHDSLGLPLTRFHRRCDPLDFDFAVLEGARRAHDEHVHVETVSLRNA